jgi:hypothetical protein
MPQGKCDQRMLYDCMKKITVRRKERKEGGREGGKEGKKEGRKEVN